MSQPCAAVKYNEKKNIYIYSFEVITHFLSEVPVLLGIRQWMKHDLRKKTPKNATLLIVFVIKFDNLLIFYLCWFAIQS